MINDETTWHVINQGFCSFKVKLKQPPQTFCRNQYNVSGLCNRVSCPLANSEYATVLEKEGVCYLYIKTVERAHTPKKMWEKIELSKNYAEALKQIDDNLLYWADHKKNRCKQRLTKLRQAIIRQRKLVLQGRQTQLVGIKKKTERREATREAKAEKAAQVELSIEKELLERLKQGTYGDLYANLNKEQFDEMLDDPENQMESDDELENQYNMEDEDEIVDERNVDFVAGDFEDDDENEEDDAGIPDDDLSDLSDEEDPDVLEGLSDIEEDSAGEEDEDGGQVRSSSSSSGRRAGGGAASSSTTGDIEDVLGKRSAKRPNKKLPFKGPKRKGPRVEIEMEEEHDGRGLRDFAKNI